MKGDVGVKLNPRGQIEPPFPQKNTTLKNPNLISVKKD